MTALGGAILGAAVSATPASPSETREPRESRRGLLDEATFILPGAQYVDWVPTHAERPRASGGGVEVSVARHLAEGAWVLGAVAQVERVGRWRLAGGVEAGYEFFGLELCAARELASADTRAQWSLQLAPYVSAGLLTIAARWIVALSARDAIDAPGDGAMIVFGFKLPIALGGVAKDPR